MPITIIDNGKDADKIAGLLTCPKKIIKPEEIGKEKLTAVIISDGAPKKCNQKFIEFIQNFDKPMLGIGLGCLYMVTAFGGTIREGKGEKNILVSVNRINPLTNEMKKKFKAVRENNFFIDSLPECYDVVATAGREIAMINDVENPCFGIHFNPELDAETLAIIRNFQNFVEVWGKYHK